MPQAGEWAGVQCRRKDFVPASSAVQLLGSVPFKGTKVRTIPEGCWALRALLGAVWPARPWRPVGLIPQLSLGFPGNGLPMLPSLPTGRIARPRDFWEITGNIPGTRGSLASPRPPMGLAPSSREARSQKPGVILRTRGFVGKQGDPRGAKGQSWALRVFALANSVREVRKERTLTLSV